jgi:hypothetical protein
MSINKYFFHVRILKKIVLCEFVTCLLTLRSRIGRKRSRLDSRHYPQFVGERPRGLSPDHDLTPDLPNTREECHVR